MFHLKFHDYSLIVLSLWSCGRSLGPYMCISILVYIWPQHLTFSLISNARLHRGSASLYFPLFPYRTAKLFRVAATYKTVNQLDWG